MKLFFFFLPIALMVSACFKFEPKHEVQRIAGSWEIRNTEINWYSISGGDSTTSKVSDLGYLHLYYSDDFMFENSYSQTISPNYTTMNNSLIKAVLDQSNIWWVSVDSKNMGFGLKDYSTGYVTTIATITLKRKSINRYQLIGFTRYADGKLKSYEVWDLKRD
jgi:hypothetical protein